MAKIYCWMSDALKKSLDAEIDSDKMKKYFVSKQGEQDTDTMYKLGFYTFPGKTGLLFAVPDEEGQEKVALKYESIHQLQHDFQTYMQKTAEKYIGLKDEVEPTFSSFIIYDGGLEAMVGEIKEAVEMGREVRSDLLEQKVKPYLGLAGLISGIESGSGVKKDDFDALTALL